MTSLQKQGTYRVNFSQFWETLFGKNVLNFWWLTITYFCLQDIKIFFEDVDFYAKLSLILDILVKKSTTQWTMIYNIHRPLYVQVRYTSM